jgi:hypothetical protein
MKTNRSGKMVRNLVLALAGAVVFAGLASAQTAGGRFTLPFEAHWGPATLPAGDYSFTLDKLGPGSIVQLSRGTKTVALVMSPSYSMESSGPTALTVVRNSAGNTVRDLRLPEFGVVLHYAPHKPGRASAAAEREIAQMIPITTSGK